MSEEKIQLSEIESRYSRSVRTVEFKVSELKVLLPDELGDLSVDEIKTWVEENVDTLHDALNDHDIDLKQTISDQSPEYYDDDPDYIGYNCHEQRGWDHANAEEIEIKVEGPKCICSSEPYEEGAAAYNVHAAKAGLDAEQFKQFYLDKYAVNDLRDDMTWDDLVSENYDTDEFKEALSKKSLKDILDMNRKFIAAANAEEVAHV